VTTIPAIRGVIKRRILVNYRVEPLAIHHARLTFFERIEASAPGTVSPDNALIMRDVPHEWQALPQLNAAR
jgi:hypothetical protein